MTPDLQPTPDVEAIERDLDRLAGHRGGFDRPEALSREFRCLPDLPCVARLSGARELSRIERVLASREVLRASVDRMEDAGTRLAASLLLFLFSTSELRTHGLPDDFFAEGIGARRQAIEELLDLRGFRQNHEPRVLALAAGELARLDREITLVAKYESEDGAPSAAHETDNANAITRALHSTLGRRYLGLHPTRSLVDVISPDRKIYYNVDLDLQLRATGRAGHYEYNLTTTFSAELDEYVVGYVVAPDTADDVLARCPQVTDVFSCSSQDACEQQVRDAEASADMVVSLARVDGRMTQKAVRMRAVPDADRHGYLGELELEQAAEVRLVRAVLQPKSAQEPGRALRRLRVKQALTLPLSDHFCYWVADRPIYVRRINVDVRGLSDSIRDGHGPRLQPFAMSGKFGARLHDEPIQHLDVENWFVRGQGFVVIW